MARYIDAEAFKKRLIEKGFYPAIVARALEEMPSADVVEVKHGEWVGGEFNNYSGEYGEQCSNCTKFSREYTRPYCPNCGAKMDGVNYESTKTDKG